MKKTSLAIILARGGSKRIPRKNIKPFLGQPAIKYPIKAAMESKCFTEVMVSTEDKEIAQIAKSYGVKVPFLRSNQNANDHASTIDVVKEVILAYKKKNIEFEYFCCLYGSALLVTARNIKRAFKKMIKAKADSVFLVAPFDYPIQKALKIEHGYLKPIFPTDYNKRTQDLVSAYQDSGQFYWSRVKVFLKKGKIFTKNTVALIISELEVQDIDNLEDWNLAEIKYKFFKN